MSFSDWSQYLALRGAVGVLGRISWQRAGAMGAWLGARGYRPLGIRRDVVETQIAAAFPDIDASEVRRISRASYEHLGRMAIETALIPTLSQSEILDLVEEVEGWDVVERTMAAGRGAMLVTGHLGNWELGGAVLAARGLKVAAVVRGQANPHFDRYLHETRGRFGARVITAEEAVRATPRLLRENYIIAFLTDQGVKGLASTFVPFFGRLAKTPRGPAVFTLRLDVPLVFGASVRLPSGRYKMAFEELPVQRTGDRDRDIDTIVADYTMALERWVRRYPGQYFWQHRRWRRRPPGDLPGEVASQ